MINKEGGKETFAVVSFPNRVTRTMSAPEHSNKQRKSRRHGSSWPQTAKTYSHLYFEQQFTRRRSADLVYLWINVFIQRTSAGDGKLAAC